MSRTKMSTHHSMTITLNNYRIPIDICNENMMKYSHDIDPSESKDVPVDR